MLKSKGKVQDLIDVRRWCVNKKHLLLPDKSNYAKGRYKLWLFHEVDFRDGSLRIGYTDSFIWDLSQYIYPGSNIALLTYNGFLPDGSFSDGRIDLHRDHTYASSLAVGLNLGECVFQYGDGLLRDYQLKDGDVVEFNCKTLHGVKFISSLERFSIVFWKLNESKGYKRLID